MSGKAADIAAVFFLAFLLAAAYFLIIKPEERQGMGFYSENTLDTDYKIDIDEKADIDDKIYIGDKTDTGDKMDTDDKTDIDDNATVAIPIKEEPDIIPKNKELDTVPGDKVLDTVLKNKDLLNAFPGKEKSQGQEEHEIPTESDTFGEKQVPPLFEEEVQAVYVLKELYSYSEKLDDYSDAMELLTDDFTMKLNMFERFGVERIDKSDVTGERIQAFARVLMSSNLKDIIATKNEENRIIIEYLHAMDLEDSGSIELKLVADLVNDSGVWKIACIREIQEGNIEKAGNEPALEPF